VQARIALTEADAAQAALKKLGAELCPPGGYTEAAGSGVRPDTMPERLQQLVPDVSVCVVCVCVGGGLQALACGRLSKVRCHPWQGF
jgi:hypothetical protein